MAKNWISVKKRNGKRQFFRRRGGGGKARRARRLKYNIQGTLIPDRTCVRLKYARDIKMTLSGIGAVNSLLYRCNSIFDPQEAVAVDPFPLGYKQYEEFYEKYMVIGSKISVTWKSLNQNDETNPQSGNASVAITTIANTSDTITDSNEIMCNNRTTYKNLCLQRPYARISKKFNPKRFFGVSKLLDNQQYGAPFGANPNQEAFWQLSCWNPASDNTARTLYVNVMISYICVLRERKNIGL